MSEVETGEVDVEALIALGFVTREEVEAAVEVAPSRVKARIFADENLIVQVVRSRRSAIVQGFSHLVPAFVANQIQAGSVEPPWDRDLFEIARRAEVHTRGKPLDEWKPKGLTPTVEPAPHTAGDRSDIIFTLQAASPTVRHSAVEVMTVFLPASVKVEIINTHAKHIDLVGPGYGTVFTGHDARTTLRTIDTDDTIVAISEHGLMKSSKSGPRPTPGKPLAALVVQDGMFRIDRRRIDRHSGGMVLHIAPTTAWTRAAVRNDTSINQFGVDLPESNGIVEAPGGPAAIDQALAPSVGRMGRPTTAVEGSVLAL